MGVRFTPKALDMFRRMILASLDDPEQAGEMRKVAEVLKIDLHRVRQDVREEDFRRAGRDLGIDTMTVEGLIAETRSIYQKLHVNGGE